MTQPDVAMRGWSIVGDTSNSRFFQVRSGLLCAVPRDGSLDDFETATENREFQESYFRRIGSPGAIIVLMDGFTSQDHAARTVYLGYDDRLLRGVALVASSLLGRAIASFSIGLRQSKLPIKSFATLELALAWAEKV
ncbi:hypothetical protein AKJ09_00454 [Labilithrix luteola]|uniref:DUF7793 domain-containing protein n=1 Tax=Labilithrix luteola TaxID=1391654 RepID=A0A0K1PJU5_9BACT|nr:hypothetical protein [Labilithrix luteola]AKU93790.1 hypothetical protein AKJ09_00454 [Labilithrix luteola]